jgi:hypothetical protein
MNQTLKKRSGHLILVVHAFDETAPNHLKKANYFQLVFVFKAIARWLHVSLKHASLLLSVGP